MTKECHKSLNILYHNQYGLLMEPYWHGGDTFEPFDYICFSHFLKIFLHIPRSACVVLSQLTGGTVYTERERGAVFTHPHRTHPSLRTRQLSALLWLCEALSFCLKFPLLLTWWLFIRLFSVLLRIYERAVGEWIFLLHLSPALKCFSALGCRSVRRTHN